jgi:hypothetical protein
MKMPIAALVFSTIFMVPSAVAESVFGQNTWDLEGKFEAPREQHDFYKGETISLSKIVRLGGLYPFEKQLIEMAMSARGKTGVLEEKLEEFSMTDGYLTYFSHRPTRRQFVQVGHFPGDNEFGLIVEIKVTEAGTEILGPVAKIDDGQFKDCLF